MNRWSKFAEKVKQDQSVETEPRLTMNLRVVKKVDGSTTVEQLVEYRNQKGMIVNTEWVEVPTIMEQ